jgi:hypothetical protein
MLRTCYWDETKKELLMSDTHEPAALDIKTNDYVMIKEAADFLGITQGRLRTMERREGKIKTYQNPFGSCTRCRLYKKSDLEDLLNSIKPY